MATSNNLGAKTPFSPVLCSLNAIKRALFHRKAMDWSGEFVAFAVFKLQQKEHYHQP